ncbi:MAG TPA: anti-sigma F factor antagonist [Treponema sp.]|jgi:anti-anti-sigma factor|nr:STAS domain-containing protein [Treponema sp.]HAK68914.1 anti-sigma F factor antagonist [Treponema sp.]HBB42890.1 anti-sigma F factor antagonist [Treponema sp.]HCA20073.1 anti-sigma F factor antagonist [Treponema sp.]
MNNEFVPGFDDDKDDSLKIQLDKVAEVDGCLMVILNGYIDTYNSVYFHKQIGKVVSAGFVNLIFNCASLNYVSSTGIGSFTAFLKLVKPKGGDIVLLNIQPKVYEVFQLLGFSQFFNIKESMADATDFFKRGTPTESTVFPKVFNCPVCSRRLKATKSGRFRCSDCKSILAIDQQGHVFLG